MVVVGVVVVVVDMGLLDVLGGGWCGVENFSLAPSRPDGVRMGVLDPLGSGGGVDVESAVGVVVVLDDVCCVVVVGDGVSGWVPLESDGGVGVEIVVGVVVVVVDAASVGVVGGE